VKDLIGGGGVEGRTRPPLEVNAQGELIKGVLLHEGGHAVDVPLRTLNGPDPTAEALSRRTVDRSTQPHVIRRARRYRADNPIERALRDMRR
jgi:hypothetical protein